MCVYKSVTLVSLGVKRVGAICLALAKCLIRQAQLLGCAGVMVRKCGPIMSVGLEAQFGSCGTMILHLTFPVL
jgi:hypothetical protein